MKAPSLAATRYVLDSSALLAVLFVEPGGDIVADAITHAIISAVNTAEVVTKLVDKGLQLSDASRAVGIFQIQTEPFDTQQALAAAALRAPTSKHGLSLGDRACLALASKLSAPVLTADKAWGKLDLGIEIKVIR